MTPRRQTVILGLACAFLATGRADSAEPTAYDTIESAYAPYLDKADPLSFPLKIKSLAANEYTFWRGSKDLFFQWCKTHCTDWLADKQAFLPNHGDLHLGNIGTYASEEGWGTLAFGMVDFDDSTRLPFEFELLQGAITIELVSRQNKIELGGEQRAQLLDTLLETYKRVTNSRRTPTDALADNPTVRALAEKGRKKQYQSDLEKFTLNGKFRPAIKKKQAVTDLLDPVDSAEWNDFADAIAAAIANDDRLRGLLKTDFSSAKAIRKQIKDVVRRTRIGSSGSQGLRKYLVLLSSPLKDQTHDLILYLKQEIPSAAERSGIVPRDKRSPGQRCAEDMDHITEPRPLLNSWCELQGRSFWVHFKEPWSDELDYEDIESFDELLNATVIWATVTAATHREAGRFEMIRPRLTPELRAAIETRSGAYLENQASNFRAFATDERTKAAETLVHTKLQLSH